MGPPAPKFLLLDACVVIDFCEADRKLLSLTAKHLGDVFVSATVLAEVDDLDRAGATALGLQVVDPTPEQLHSATVRRRSLSFVDQINLLLAKENGFICVTNDRALRSACADERVDVLWGLELLTRLVEERALSRAAAVVLARTICTGNRTLGSQVLQRVLRKLK